MFCGFDFTAETADADCQAWLDEHPDVELEYIETQRASLANMLRLSPTLTEEGRAALQRAEQQLHNHLLAQGAVSAPALHDDALGGDLLDLGFDATPL